MPSRRRESDGDAVVAAVKSAFEDLRRTLQLNSNPSARRGIVRDWLEKSERTIDNRGAVAICLSFVDTVTVLNAPITDDELIRQLHQYVGCQVDQSDRSVNVSGTSGPIVTGSDVTFHARDINTFSTAVLGSTIDGDLKTALIDCRKAADQHADLDEKRLMLTSLETIASQSEKPKAERKEAAWKSALATAGEFAKAIAPFATLATLAHKIFAG